ncbi:MAG TPA: polyphenol oxidase family protein [Solirubrobacteraceae bacterium]
MSAARTGEAQRTGEALHDDELSLTLAGGARVLFCSRADGNLSTQRGVDAERGRARRDELCKRLGLDWLCASRQVHGSDVHVIRTRALSGGEPAALDADGHATALRGVGAMVLTADCLPVALAGDGQARAVAMLHAGWRGLAAGVLERGVQALRELRADGAIEAAIGPGAGTCCYEVGAEVHAAFDAGAHRLDGDGPGAAHGPGERADDETRRGAIDLRAIARERLLAAGVARVHDVRACTICDERFFSHRRERERAGRQAGVAWLS